jgi:hypothetical protein
MTQELRSYSTSKISPEWTWLSKIDFEIETKHGKGATTEDAGLKILAIIAKSSNKQIWVIERPYPPSVGEFDAICCTDSGLILVELKRWGGYIQNFNILDRKIQIDSGRKNNERNNPSAILQEKSKRLIQKHISRCLKKHKMDNDAWLRAKSVFPDKKIPVFNVVCYGPSTFFERIPKDESGENHICTTRTLSKTIWGILHTYSAVIGAGAQMASIASSWAQWGILTQPGGRKGFLRCSISSIASSDWDASPWGLQSIESDGKNLSLIYKSGQNGKIPFDQDVWLNVYDGRVEKRVLIDHESSFRWRIKGR